MLNYYDPVSLLPEWVLTGTQPAIYDADALTAIQMVARLYGKMQEIIKHNNEFAANIQTLIDDVESTLANVKETIVQTATDLFIDAVNNGDIVATFTITVENEEMTISPVVAAPAP